MFNTLEEKPHVSLMFRRECRKLSPFASESPQTTAATGQCSAENFHCSSFSVILLRVNFYVGKGEICVLISDIS